MTLLEFSTETAADDLHPAQWRLATIEMVNWGTFPGFVAIDVARRGHLFTGASGSGKSSLLDAIAATLTPDKWLRLNAAAQDGASRQSDRTLMSYVRGAWTKEADEHADRATTTYLRPRATWSGVLLRYQCEGEPPVVLARVFHAPGTHTDPGSLKDARIFFRGELGLLDLEDHVRNGIDARRMTAGLPEALITTGGRHGRFHERVVRQFGFRGESTLQLLHKTQSAKNLGTLDALFRGFMLEAPTSFARADNAVEQFTELAAAHAHVTDLRRQAEVLREIDAAITAWESASADVAMTAERYDAVDPFTAALRLKLTRDALGPARIALTRADSAAVDAERERALARDAFDAAASRVRDEGGARVEVLQERVTTAEREAATVVRDRSTLANDLGRVGISIPQDAQQFAELSAVAKDESGRQIASIAYDVRDAATRARDRLRDVERQLQALRDHRSNLDPALLAARRYIAGTMGLPEQALPFGGELVAVLPEYDEWRGAIERVLAPLATTLLVHDEHLSEARRAIDGRNLGTRLVIEAVAHASAEPRRPRDPRSLRHRVRVSNGPFAGHLLARLASEFDYACVAHPDELEEVAQGVTIAGLVKRSARRYEKNDRFDVRDATRWALGGDTEARLEALLALQADAQGQVDATGRVERDADQERETAVRRQSVLRRLADLTWARIDVGAAETTVRARRAELDALTSGSSVLRDAQAQYERAREARTTAEDTHDLAITTRGIRREFVERLEAEIAELDAAPAARLTDEILADLDARFRSQRRSLTRDSVGDVARAVQSALSVEKDSAAQRRGDAGASYAARASRFRLSWPAAGADLTTEIDDREAYRALLSGILARGLPEKETEFRRLLQERSRDVVAHLLSELRDAPGLVRDRILPVNASLGRSPFDGDNRFLEIDVRTARSAEVTAFLDELRRIVEGNWADESVAGAERRFAVLQGVIGRLGSKDRVDLDWRNRVLDTRLHVTFLAREKDAIGRVTRVYDSAEGLSGGQRQKLVIFCLAAALRFQLTEEESDVPKFGSLVLDEAFDKADSSYTRNAMEVFRDFGFHMILATPQKLLQTLEPYVGAVTAVSNPDRNRSRIANVVMEAAEPDVNGEPS